LRGKQVEYSTPIFYFPLYAVVRADDHRFDNNYEAMNDPAVRITDLDGGMNALVRAQQFPKATADDLQGNLPETTIFQEIDARKADVTFDDYATIAGYDKMNPGKIRRVKGAPVRIIPANVSFAAGEFRLQQMLNTATEELLYNGVTEKILEKYEPEPGAFLRVAPPYVGDTKP